MDANIIKSDLIVEKLNYKSIADLVFDRLKHNSDDNCLIDSKSERKWSKRQVLDSCLNFAYYLINDCKLIKGDVVCFIVDSPDYHVIAFLGVLMAGGVCYPLPYDTTEYEIQRNFQTICPSIVVCNEGNYECLRRHTMTKNILLIENHGTQTAHPSVSEIFSLNRKADIEIPVPTDPEDNAVLSLTSGSTGQPKGFMNTNRVLLASIEAVLHRDVMTVSEDDILMLFNMCYGMCRSTLFTAIAANTQIVLNSCKQFEEQLNVINSYRITNVFFSPSELNYLVKNYNTFGTKLLKSLRTVWTGGSTLSETTLRFIQNNYLFENLIISYGMSESGYALYMTIKRGHHFENYSTNGKPFPSTEIKVIDESGNSLPANTMGEICICSEQVFSGYLNNSEENENLFTFDGFIKSGDVGYYDDNHLFYICDRIKIVIKFNGNCVSPTELENILLMHSDVTNAAVIGIEDEEWDEVPIAFVTVTKGSNISIEELTEYVNSRVNSEKQLRGGLRILDSFPMTHSGKISKTKLKAFVVKSAKKITEPSMK